MAEAALRIADSEGFEALSMRRLADELGAGTMTLYHYVRTKEDLIELLDDAVMAEVVIADGAMPAHWRPALAMLARSSYQAFIRHPWALQALQSARFGPNGMMHFEQSLAAVERTGLALAERMTILGIVDDFVFGHVFRNTDERMQRKRGERGARELAAIIAFATAQLASGRFPNIQALQAGPDPAAAWHRFGKMMEAIDRFEIGLEVILDGIALRWKLPSETAEPKPRSRTPRKKTQK